VLNGGTVGEADAVWLVSNIVIVPQFSTHNFVRSRGGVYPPKELTRSRHAVSDLQVPVRSEPTAEHDERRWIRDNVFVSRTEPAQSLREAVAKAWRLGLLG
jgi:hypothetical protein